jgi:hypothetical protein
MSAERLALESLRSRLLLFEVAHGLRGWVSVMACQECGLHLPEALLELVAQGGEPEGSGPPYCPSCGRQSLLPIGRRLWPPDEDRIVEERAAA